MSGSPRRVLVVGLRATGASVVGHAARLGDVVTVVEDGPGQPGYHGRVSAARELGAEVVERPSAAAWPELVAGADLVVVSPGVRPTHPVYAAATAASVPVRGDVDLGVELARVPVVAITGTNGKSTVTTLVAEMLRAAGVAAITAGNIGRTLLDVLDEPADALVVEVSSFQLHATTEAFRPRVAVLLNIAPDHLDWHGSFAEYVAAKSRLFAHQRDGDLLVFNEDDPVVCSVAQRAPARRTGFTTGTPRAGSAGVVGGNLVAPDGTVLAPIDALGRRAPHDLANAVAAAVAALELDASPAGIRRALSELPRLHHRMEPVGKACGVDYVDDSKATNPHATLAAIGGFDHVVLIAGGDSKGVDLGPLARGGAGVRAVVAIGDRPEEVERVFADVVPTVRAGSMGAAVRAASELARPGDTVLLSPACASFDWYRSYEERGDAFRREVEALVASREAVG